MNVSVVILQYYILSNNTLKGVRMLLVLVLLLEETMRLL